MDPKGVLTPALVLLSGECPGSVLQGSRPGSVAPIGCGLGGGRGRRELAAPSRQQRRGRASSRAPKGRGDGGVDPSRESELLLAGPPSPRPRRPSFLPLTPGRAGGCWTGTDKGLADWPRLIGAGLTPEETGGRGSLSAGPAAPPPAGDGPSLHPSGPHLPSPQALEWLRASEDPDQCTAGSDGPGCTQRGN